MSAIKVWTDQEYREWLWSAGRKAAIADLRKWGIVGVAKLTTHEIIEKNIAVRHNLRTHGGY